MKMLVKRLIGCVSLPVMVLAISPAALAVPTQWRLEDGGNGHFYDFVPDNITWSTARAQAQATIFGGTTGYLATVTSQAEKEFLRQSVPRPPWRAWLGGFQDTNALDYSEPGGGWRWITGEPWQYTNWASPEPNNFNSGEDFLEIDTAANSPDAFGWSDQENFESTNTGYYIEFGTTGVTSLALVPNGTTWKYLDNGSNQGIAWRTQEFDDATWDSGPAQLGYGDNDEATVVGFGGNASDKFATTYFRHTFTVDNVSQIEEISASLLRDDAGAVYLNGVEIFRDDTLPVDAAFDTLATAVGRENGTISFDIENALLVEGENVLAVEIHQATRGSSDISFDLRLTAVVNPIPEPGTLSLLAIGWGTLLCRRRRRSGIARGELALESNGTS